MEKYIASIIRVTRMGELGKTLALARDRNNMLLLLVTANVRSWPILVTLMMEAICSFVSSVLTRATRHNIPQDGILHSHCCEKLKSYIALNDWAL
jgi:hypothetical protein